jgi:hypothetical protein
MVGVGMDEDSFVLLFLFSKRKSKAVCDEISRFWVDGMKASGRQLICVVRESRLNQSYEKITHSLQPFYR